MEAPLSVSISAALFLPQRMQAKSRQATLEQQELNKSSQTSPQHNTQICTQPHFCLGDRWLFILFIFYNLSIQLFDPYISKSIFSSCQKKMFFN